MKKIIVSFILICFLNPVFSQDDENTLPKKQKPKKEFKQETFVGFHLGISLVGILNKGLREMQDSSLGYYKYTGKSSPVIGLSADAFISKRVSAGINFSFQTIKMDIDSWLYFDNYLNQKVNYNNKASLTRTYIGGKMLFHYVNNSRADIYSGFRAGLISWKMKLSNPNSELKTQIYSDMIYLNRPALGLIPFGFRVKVKEKFAVCGEFTLGAPNFISAGITYQISENKKKK